MTRNNKWSSLALLSVLTLAGLAGAVDHAAAEPLRAEQNFSAGRIAQQRTGALDRREPVRAPEVKKRDDKSQQNRVELERQQPQRQRAGRVDKRR
jgi:hypothetical protein